MKLIPKRLHSGRELMMIEEAGATTETAKSLGIGASTLRKYAAALEEQGYRFERSANKSDYSSPTTSSALNA